MATSVALRNPQDRLHQPLPSCQTFSRPITVQYSVDEGQKDGSSLFTSPPAGFLFVSQNPNTDLESAQSAGQHQLVHLQHLYLQPLTLTELNTGLDELHTVC